MCRAVNREGPPQPSCTKKHASKFTACMTEKVHAIPLSCGARLLGGSMDGTYLSASVRLNKRSAQSVLRHARTARHRHSMLIDGLENFLAAPASIRSPLPQSRTSSAQPPSHASTRSEVSPCYDT
ncbi:hypothetical protein HPB47_001623 [Ixodes persulcatus]|uniref:Uncharacterized protein n=1 Tax=Ixodes persulcatus TaxID=34615 RepID=A0AC60PNH2_IXOPE|nr:hypothetical protein HPB47_001623 [Ixodes persulcatus]